MDREKSDAPTFWIIAGPNGSGKSSLYGSNRDNIYGNTSILDFFRSFWIINPDLLASRIRLNEKLGQRAANFEAVKRIESWLDASIKAHHQLAWKPSCRPTNIEGLLGLPKSEVLKSGLSM